MGTGNNETVIGLTTGNGDSSHSGNEQADEITSSATISGKNMVGIELKEDGTIREYPLTKPVPEKMKKKPRNDWKKKYLTSRGWLWVMSITIIFMGMLLFWTLRGNHTMQLELNSIINTK